MEPSPDPRPPGPKALAPALPASIVENLPDAVIVVDRRWHITFANAEARRLIRCDKPTGADFWATMPEAVEQARDHHYRRAMTDGVAVRFEQQSARNRV